MLINISGTHLFNNTAQQYYSLGEEMYQAMLIDLKKAEKFIYMEYFIIEEGRFWNAILEILEEYFNIRFNYYVKRKELNIKIAFLFLKNF